MEIDLEELLQESGVEYQPISKSEKIKLLGQWSKLFPEMSDKSEDWGNRACLQDTDAWQSFLKLENLNFFLLPQDSFPAYQCSSKLPPDLRTLVDDSFSSCNEVILLSGEADWSLALVNHTTDTGLYFLRREE